MTQMMSLTLCVCFFPGWGEGEQQGRTSVGYSLRSMYSVLTCCSLFSLYPEGHLCSIAKGFEVILNILSQVPVTHSTIVYSI